MLFSFCFNFTHFKIKHYLDTQWAGLGNQELLSNILKCIAGDSSD